ncbi:MAG TPA: hypothetical protein VGJ82_12615 [Thermoanaerobaculia bacterium]
MDDEELKRFIRETEAETRRHIDILFERQETRFAAVNEAISSLEERTRRGFATVDERIGTESSETRSMIRISYTELDRRLRSLEERVERLEQTIH